VGHLRRWIQSECAFTYMNAGFRRTCQASWLSTQAAGDTTAHSTQSQDRARFGRTTVTRIWGVSDPLLPKRAPRQGGGRGVAHAPDAFFTAVASRADGRASIVNQDRRSAQTSRNARVSAAPNSRDLLLSSSRSVG